jgi:hypothetical protein
MSLRKKISYVSRVLPGAIGCALGSPVREPVHLMIAVADHFEPAIDPAGGEKRVPMSERERRLQWWSREYPKAADPWRDHDGRPFVHTYFCPAEQYEEGLLEMIAEHCHSGWGETEIHLHHGIPDPDTAENTRSLLTDFRDRLAFRHRCLAVEEGSGQPRYCFVHGNFALANSADGRMCGVDSEMKVLAETGCYADFTLPTAPLHSAQIAKMNSLYECGLPLDEAAPHRTGTDLRTGRAPGIFPLMVQGPLLVDFGRSWRALRLQLETGAITPRNPMSLDRLALWKQARVHVAGRQDWLFIKLHCHSMDPTQKDVVVGHPFRKFLEQLVGGAKERKETLHFVTAREMTNIILAACDGKEGNPGHYRDYRFKLFKDMPRAVEKSDSLPVVAGANASVTLKG